MQSDSHYKRREVPGNKGQRGEMNNHGGEFENFSQEGTFCCILINAKECDRAGGTDGLGVEGILGRGNGMCKGWECEEA